MRKRRDPESGAKLKEIEEALEQVARGVGHLLYLDECDLHLLPVIRSMWMRRGQRVLVPTPGKNAKHAFFGALEAWLKAHFQPRSGLFHWVDHDRKLAVNFLGFLTKLAETYSEGPLFLVLDGAPTHRAKVVKKWLLANPRVQLLFLPKYSAHESNPAERIWGLMKDGSALPSKNAVAANRLAGNMGELVAKARQFFDHDLTSHPVKLPVGRLQDEAMPNLCLYA